MARLIRKHTGTTAGLPPGSLVYVGDATEGPVKISVIDYDEESFHEQEDVKPGDCQMFKDKETITWINVGGLQDTAVVEELGACFGFHPLLLADVLNTGQRPKMDDLGERIFVIMKMLYSDPKLKELRSEQLSIVLGKGYVISFQENEGSVFNNIRERLREGRGRIRKMGADYLAYVLMDAVVDNYFMVLEHLGAKMEEMEAEIMKDPPDDTPQTIHHLKRDMIFLRRSIWPMRELFVGLERSESELISKPTLRYLRDVYDHSIHLMDIVESYRDLLTGMLETYRSTLSHKMNEVMQVLTIIATIFIPLTFLAGIYGMNFENIPELGWEYSYPTLLLVMFGLGLWMVQKFRNIGWI